MTGWFYTDNGCGQAMRILKVLDPPKEIVKPFFIVREGKWMANDESSKVNSTRDMHLLGDVDPNN